MAPTTIVTGILYYFGWVYTNARSSYFGIDPGSLQFSTTDYLLRSIQPIFIPLTAILSVALGTLALHGMLLAQLSGRREALFKRVSTTLILLGAGLIVVAAIGTARQGVLPVDLLLVPLCLAGGTLLASYGVYLRRRLAPPSVRNEEQQWVNTTSVILISVVALLATLWAMGDWAEALGRASATDTVARLATRPSLVVYSKYSLAIQPAHGVQVEELTDRETTFRYRYRGLRLLLRAAGRYFLLPDGWQPGTVSAIVLRDNDDIRVEYVAPDPKEKLSRRQRAPSEALSFHLFGPLPPMRLPLTDCAKDLVITSTERKSSLTVTADFSGTAAWSPDSTRILYTTQGAIYIARRDGAARRMLTADGESPAWSPDGRSIAFISGRDGNAEVYVMDADGNMVRRVTSEPAPDRAPVWVDNERIAFVRLSNGRERAFVARMDGSSAVPLEESGVAGFVALSDFGAPDEIVYFSPAGQYAVQLPVGSAIAEVKPSPSGDSIAAILFDADRLSDVFVFPNTGGNGIKLTSDAAREFSLSWSPDGTRIAYVSNQTGGSDIYLVGAKGGESVNLTKDPALDYGPTWAPDGARISFASDRHGPGNGLYVVDVRDFNVVRLTQGETSAFPKGWSPDQKWIAYSRCEL